MSDLEAEETAKPAPDHGCGISLILPAWNESEALPGAIREADSALQSVNVDYEIIVVDDGSTDGTAEVVQGLISDSSSLRLIRHSTNKGYGAALRTGFSAARCDLVVFTDSDVQFDLREIDRFVLLSRDYDIVCGYRIDRKDSPLRCFYSQVYNLLVRMLLGTRVRDIDCAFKMFRRDKLQQLTVNTDGFLVNTELLTKAGQQGLSLVEVGVSHRPRNEGESTVSIQQIPIVLRSLLRFWWNQVQFPCRTSQAGNSETLAVKPTGLDKYIPWLQVALILIAALLLLTGLSYPLIDRDETRYAEIPREMIETGDWLVPQLNYKTYCDKPPLLYWTCAASYSLFGVSEWSARLVPTLSGLLTLATTMLFGNKLFNRRVGLLAGIAMLVSVGFLGGSRILLIDGLLTTCVAFSLFAGCEAVRSGRLQIAWWVAAALATGLGFLAKGPIALVLFLPPMACFAWLTETAILPRAWHWLLFGGIVTVVAAPWFIAVNQQVPDFAYQFFYRHNIERFGGAFHAQPAWYFLPVLLLGGHPWSFLTLPFVNYVTTGANAVRKQRSPDIGFLVLWAIWVLAFFTLSRCKLPPYILPAAPALALLAGKYFENLFWLKAKTFWTTYATRWAPWLATGATCLTAAGFVTFGLHSGWEPAHQASLIFVISLATLPGTVILQRRVRNPFVGWAICVVATFIAATFVLHREIPRYAIAQTLFGPSSPISKQLADAEDLPVITVGHEWSGVPFYLQKNNVSNFEQIGFEEISRLDRKARQILVILHSTNGGFPLRGCLPTGASMRTVAQRGNARLVILDMGSPQQHVASPIQEKNIVR